jgi:HSP20 family molecular chaperone IbpA
MAAPGLVSQAFSLSFTLADNMEVSGATFTNGLLHIDLTRNEPEHRPAAYRHQRTTGVK